MLPRWSLRTEMLDKIGSEFAKQVKEKLLGVD